MSEQVWHDCDNNDCGNAVALGSEEYSRWYTIGVSPNSVERLDERDSFDACSLSCVVAVMQQYANDNAPV